MLRTYAQNMRADMWTHMRADMCVSMRADMCVDMRVNMHVAMRVAMRVDRLRETGNAECIDVCVDLTKTCGETCACTGVYEYVRHVCGRKAGQAGSYR